MKIFVTIFFCCLILTPLVLGAQRDVVRNYQWFTGGNLRLTYDNKETLTNNERYDVNITKTLYRIILARQVNDKLALGMNPYFYQRIVHIQRSITDIEKLLSQQYGVSIFSRHRLKKIGKFSLAIEPSAGYKRGFYDQTFYVKDERYIDRARYTGFNVNAAPVVTFQFAPRLRLSTYLGSVSYGFTYNKRNEFDLQNAKSEFNAGFSVSGLVVGAEFLF